MSISRRSFVATAASIAAGASVASAAPTSAFQSFDLESPLMPNDLVSTSSSNRDDDPLGVRKDFPVVQQSLYLNSAYIAPVPLQVVAIGRDFVERKSTHPIQLGEMLGRTDQVRAQFAKLVNATPDEIGFLFATSEGENIVANALDLSAGDNVVIDALHYETEFVLYTHLRDTRGVELRIAPHHDGAVSVRDFEPLIDKRTKLVSVAWVSHQNGFRHD
ncbi:MAG: aminotransferase class V-fold PLP-dependent enzyme, partial [Gemmatimonadaceae bacterium]